MFYVRLVHPLPGVRSQIFFFYTMEEASEFASTLHSEFGPGGPFGPDSSGAPSQGFVVETEEGEAGVASDVFPSWNF